MIKMRDLLNEINLKNELENWIGKQYHTEFNRSIFLDIKRKFPESMKYGKIYRYLNIPESLFMKYTGKMISVDDGMGNYFSSEEVVDEFDEKIRKYIYDRALKSGYCSYSKSLSGITNFVTMLIRSMNFGERGPNNQTFLISQKSSYIDLMEIPIDFDKDEITKTAEVVSIIDPNFKIEGIILGNNKIIPYHGNIDKLIQNM